MRLFGISIGEQICWATALAEPGQPGRNLIEGSFEKGKLAEFPKGSSRRQVDIQPILRQGLEQLKDERPELFTDVNIVGVSSIGVIDTESNALVSISRKHWRRVRGRSKAGDGNGAVVDFNALCDGLFLCVPGGRNIEPPIAVHNDATARAYAEYRQYWTDVRHMLYLEFDEGVNGGVIYNSMILPTNLHPEMGHIFPRLHSNDRDFSETPTLHGGCPSHVKCYEGLCSLYRIRKSWGPPDASMDFTLRDIDDDAAWNIIAFYIAQLCMAGTLIFAPQRIILAGRVISDELIPLIHDHFKALNNDYLYYNDMESAESFIQEGRMDWPDSGAMGALFLAHRRSMQFSAEERGIAQVKLRVD